MITRIVTSEGKKGIVCVKEDGRVYRVFESKLRHKDSKELNESFGFLVEDLTRKNDCVINNWTYIVGDDRRLQAKIIYDFIVGDLELTDKVEVKTAITKEHDGDLALFIKAIGVKRTVEDMIEDYMEHYHYSLKEIRCNKCNSNLGYVEGDYSIICDCCRALNRR